ncbi:hypothetical protein ACRALDRAFT_2101590, partial [Sodiomyces alcalophilus JCM 7366]|uniref:uncharacterized protein n=1 Tax=Sodiomyces alcalophilus JCM 7366 TaxID=591952 RepID=UPI0039B4CE62
ARRRLLLVGEHTDLIVYDALSGQLCARLRVFDAQPIHGITSGRSCAAETETGEEHLFLVWGDRSVAVFPASLLDASLDDGPGPGSGWSAEAADWVHDGLVIPDAGGRCLLATAHNEVVELTYSPTDRSLTFGRVVSPARPILFSAKLAWSANHDNVLVAAGTVFGEILVWTGHFSSTFPSSPDPQPLSCEVLFVFRGHEGSIYGVDISPELEIPGCDQKMRLLASCSDDRTVRVWDVSEQPDKKPRPTLMLDTFHEAWDTGFGGDATDLGDLASVSGGPIASTMGLGHIARIWKVKFAARASFSTSPHGRNMTMPVYSFGEDATAISWHLDLHLDSQSSFAHHDGKHIWSAAVAQMDERDALVATGGADGKVNLITGSSMQTDNLNNASSSPSLPKELRSITVREIIDRLSPASAGQGEYEAALPKGREVFKQFGFISADEMLVVSNTGRVLLASFEAVPTWADIPLSDVNPLELARCTAIRSPAPGFAVLGTASRKLFVYRDRYLQEIASSPGQVTDIFCLNSPDYHFDQTDGKGRTSEPTTTTDILVRMIGGPDVIRVLTIDLVAVAVVSDLPVPGQEPGYVITAARLFGDLLVTGSRHGHLTLFRRSKDGYALVTQAERRSDDAITSIVPVPGQDGPGGRHHFLTTSRDGNYRIYEINPTFNDGGVHVRLRHETSSPAVDVVEGAWFTAPNEKGARDLLLFGFRSRFFVLWNETQRHEAVALDCGGSRRLFTYRPLDPGVAPRLRFVYLKAASLHMYAQKSAAYKTIKQGTHGREVRCVTAAGRYVATGSEDTSMRIWRRDDGAVPQGYVNGDEDGTETGVYGDSGGGLGCVATVKVHTAGIQAIKWLRTGPQEDDALITCSGNEELIIWRVGRLRGGAELSVPGPTVMREAEFADKSPDGDLRILDLAVSPLELDFVAEKNAAGMLRFIITMVFSNSTCKTYLYATASGFRLLATGHYTGACLTQVRHLRVLGEGRELEILTAATDGHITVWTSAAAVGASESEQGGVAEYVPAVVTRAHQGSIKALDIVFPPPSPGLMSSKKERLLVLTGGDDNALGFTVLSRDDTHSARYAVDLRAGMKDAHAASVNGLSIMVPVEADGETTVFATASNDQRVKVWRVSLSSESGERRETAALPQGRDPDLSVALLADETSGVADPGDLEVLEDLKGEGIRRLIVVGVGMEMWRLNLTRNGCVVKKVDETK